MISKINLLLFDLIQVSIGNKDGFQEMPTDQEWRQLFIIAKKQSLASVLLDGIDKVLSFSSNSKPSVLYDWIGIQYYTITQNQVQNKRAKELYGWFSTRGYRSCVLKGQGTAQYYDHPEHRQCGDIDIWVDGDRDAILGEIRQKGYHIESIDIKHADVRFFDDVSVEVHFQPSWMYCPSTNKELQKFFVDSSERQFLNKDEIGFVHTTIDFDLVYSMVHIYRHIFSEGIGLRQLMDYYYILYCSSPKQRNEACGVLISLKMLPFAGGIMWILKECFGIKEELLLCPVNKKHGEFLLSEILSAGNFGQYDERTIRIDHNQRFVRGFVQLKRNLRFVSYYPSEVLWSPFWKLWHWYWRKRKGYL